VDQRGCLPDWTHTAACTVVDYNETLPKSFQYFADIPTRGGPLETDYCPVCSSTYDGISLDELDCTNSAITATVNIFNEVYG